MDISVKNKRDRLFFTQLFVPQASQSSYDRRAELEVLLAIPSAQSACGIEIFIKKPDAGKASPLRYLVFIHDNRMLAERAFYCFNLFRLPALSDILRFYDVTALPLEF